MGIRVVIFDLDGTITEPFFDFDAIRKEMGLNTEAGPVWEAMEKMEPEQRRHAEEVLKLHEEKAVNESRVNEDAKQTLKALRDKGIGIGILTRNTKENAYAVADKHNMQFDIVVGREDGPVKPDAFGVLKICDYFGVRPEQAIVVGDYLFDLLCAKAAGAAAVLIENHPKSKEFEAEADFIIEKLEQILIIIDNKNKNTFRKQSK